MNKSEARRLQSGIRKNIIMRDEKENAIKDKLLTFIAQRGIDTVFTYVSFGSEVDTHAFIEATNAKILVPHTADGIMALRLLESYDSLEADKWGNLLAATTQTTEITPQMAVVPMLGFNADCYRLGYGGGYYDRFLSGFDGLKVGIAFDEQLMDELPLEAHDQPLDCILTPNKIYVGRKL